MLLKIFAWLWILFGVLVLFKPQILKNRFQKKAARKLKKYLFSIIIVLGILLISFAGRFSGVLAKIAVVIGIIAVLKGLFLFRAKAADKLIELVASQPLVLFRIGACFYIAVGVLLLLLR